MNIRNSEHVVIVGAGTTGISAFVELVEHKSAKKIDIIDPGPPGRGMAFANTREELLCNTPAESMSLLAHDSNDFIDYLKSRDIHVHPNDCVPRVYVSQYANQRYRDYCSKAKQSGIDHTYLNDHVLSIEKMDSGWYRLNLRNEAPIYASHVLICHGYGKPLVPEVLREHRERPGIFISPYPEQAMLNSLKPRSKVLILGTRLSAIDAALLLAKHDHWVTMSSPSGEIPAVRTRAPDLSDQIFLDLGSVGLNEAHCRERLLRTISKVLRDRGQGKLSDQTCRSTETIERLRSEIELAKNDSIPWQDLLLVFLKQGNDLLAKDMSRIPGPVLKKCMRMATRYLSAIPVTNAEKLLSYLERKVITILASTPTHISECESWQVGWNDRASFTEFDAIVSAAGYTKPTLFIDQGKLTIAPEFELNNREPQVSNDLRIHFTNQHAPERIWLVGVASYLRAPLVNGVFQATMQSRMIRQQLATTVHIPVPSLKEEMAVI